MNVHHAACLGILLMLSGSAAAEDVEATFSIRPSSTSVPCALTGKAVDEITGALSPDRIAALTGCPGRKVSSFDMLGQTTETYEFIDGRSRLQVTVQNNKVLSRVLRRL